MPNFLGVIAREIKQRRGKHNLRYGSETAAMLKGFKEVLCDGKIAVMDGGRKA